MMAATAGRDKKTHCYPNVPDMLWSTAPRVGGGKVGSLSRPWINFCWVRDNRAGKHVLRVKICVRTLWSTGESEYERERQRERKGGGEKDR